MTPSRYLVVQGDGAWAIRGGNRTFGPVSDRVHAIDAAIDWCRCQTIQARDFHKNRPNRISTKSRCE